MKLDKNVLKGIMTSEMGYDEASALSVLDTMPEEINTALTGALDAWLKDRTIVDTTFDGITLKEVMDAQKCNFLIALRLINNLYQDGVDSVKRQEMISRLKTVLPNWDSAIKQ